MSNAEPGAVSLSALIDAALGAVQGDVLYRSGSGWVVLPPGVLGQYLKSGGAAANLSWDTPPGTVSQLAAGSGISVFPVGGTGVVTIAAPGLQITSGKNLKVDNAL